MIMALGVAAAVTGSFLPWVQSGRVAKNSYQIAGAAERYLPDVNSAVTGAVALWPWQGPIWAAIAVLYILGLRRSAAVIGVVFALALGAVSAAVLSVGTSVDNNWISLRSIGPIFTLIGAVAVVVAGTMITLRRQIR